MMAIEQNVFTLINPQTGNIAFKLFSFDGNSYFSQVQRLNYYSIILLQSGEAKLNVDFSEYNVQSSSALFFSTYQPFMLTAKEGLKGVALHFHSDFYCIHKHQQEVACNGVLFNNIYDPPFINISTHEEVEIVQLIEQFKKELQHQNLAQHELLVSYLKILLIHCSRIKVGQQKAVLQAFSQQKEPFILQNLKEAIEEHYKEKHAPADYASLLNISAKALAKMTKSYFDKTLSDLIGERIVIEAKRELYFSSKPVKAIAYELGFDDEYYFSRFFKKNTAVSPQLYRDTVGFAKGEVAQELM